MPYGLWMEAIKNSFNTSQQNRPDTGWYQFCRISGYTEKRTNCLLLFWASCSFPALPHIWPDIRQVSDIRYPAIWKVYPAKYRKHIPVHQRTIRPYKKWNFSKQSCNKEHSFWCIISWQLNIQKGIKIYTYYLLYYLNIVSGEFFSAKKFIYKIFSAQKRIQDSWSFPRLTGVTGTLQLFLPFSTLDTVYAQGGQPKAAKSSLYVVQCSCKQTKKGLETLTIKNLNLSSTTSSNLIFHNLPPPPKKKWFQPDIP